MRAIFYLPAHPDYFGGKYSQAEIDRAFAQYDRQTGGLIFQGNASPGIGETFVLLREPRKAIAFVLDVTGLPDHAIAEEMRADAIASHRKYLEQTLATHLKNLTWFLENTGSPAQPANRLRP
jgi:hypothetical protein